MARPERFARNIRRTARGIQVNADKITRSVALAVLQAVVVGTPVDTGRARSNWNVSLRIPDRSVRETYGPAAVQQSIAAGTSVVAGARDEVPVWISNNLPYIGRLNEGSSAQAPAGFVERAVLVGEAAARRGRLLQ